MENCVQNFEIYGKLGGWMKSTFIREANNIKWEY